MRKKILSFVLLVMFCLSSTLMTACGGPKTLDEAVDQAFAYALAECRQKTGSGQNYYGADFVVPEGGYDGSKVTIKFYSTMSADKLVPTMKEYIDAFQKLYPNITVEHTQPGGYDEVRDQISTEITGGNQPNIAYCYPDHVALYNISRSTVILDNLIDSKIEVTNAKGEKEPLGYTDAQKADFIEGYYNEGKAFGDGKMYTVPFSKSTEVLYYNKTFFDANNLTLPKTWDEMETLCQKILEIDPNCIPLGVDSEANWFITMCEQLGSPYTSVDGEHFLFDNPQNREFVKEYHDWFQKGYVTTKSIFGNYTSGLFTTTGKDEIKSYMSIGSSAGATHQRPAKDKGTGKYPFEVGVTEIPQVHPDDPKVISQGPSLCIFNKKNPQEVIASWMFAKYVTTCVEFQAKFSMKSGYVPVLKSVKDDKVYSDFLATANGYDKVAALSAKVCMEQADAYYVSPAFNGSSVARDQVGNLLAKCMLYKQK